MPEEHANKQYYVRMNLNVLKQLCGGKQLKNRKQGKHDLF